MVVVLGGEKKNEEMNYSSIIVMRHAHFEKQESASAR
jgi:hypothetical protein